MVPIVHNQTHSTWPVNCRQQSDNPLASLPAGGFPPGSQTTHVEPADRHPPARPAEASPRYTAVYSGNVSTPRGRMLAYQPYTALEFADVPAGSLSAAVGSQAARSSSPVISPNSCHRPSLSVSFAHTPIFAPCLSFMYFASRYLG